MNHKKHPVTLSIIVPVYNVEAYVGECLQSILDQTFIDFELIVIDDKSTDGSLSVVHKYAAKDARIKVLEHDINQGLGLTRNTGLAVASGKYITFTDSDDYYHTLNALQIMVDAMEKTDACMVQCQFQELIDGRLKPLHRVPEYDEYVGNEIMESFQYPHTPLGHPSVCTKIFKSSLLLDNNIIFTTGIVEDALYSLEVLLHVNKVVVIPDILYAYRTREGSIMTTMNSIEKYLETSNAILSMITMLTDAHNSHSNDDDSHKGTGHKPRNLSKALTSYSHIYAKYNSDIFTNMTRQGEDPTHILQSITAFESQHPHSINTVRSYLQADTHGSRYWHYRALSIIAKNRIHNIGTADAIYNLYPIADKSLRRSYAIYTRLAGNSLIRPLSAVYREIAITPKRIKMNDYVEASMYKRKR